MYKVHLKRVWQYKEKERKNTHFVEILTGDPINTKLTIPNLLIVWYPSHYCKLLQKTGIRDRFIYCILPECRPSDAEMAIGGYPGGGGTLIVS